MGERGQVDEEVGEEGIGSDLDERGEGRKEEGE